MTVKELRQLVNVLNDVHDSKEVLVWLPGTYISLSNVTIHMFPIGGGTMLIEGNVKEGGFN